MATVRARWRTTRWPLWAHRRRADHRTGLSVVWIVSQPNRARHSGPVWNEIPVPACRGRQDRRRAVVFENGFDIRELDRISTHSANTTTTGNCEIREGHTIRPIVAASRWHNACKPRCRGASRGTVRSGWAGPGPTTACMCGGELLIGPTASHDVSAGHPAAGAGSPAASLITSHRWTVQPPWSGEPPGGQVGPDAAALPCTLTTARAADTATGARPGRRRGGRRAPPRPG